MFHARSGMCGLSPLALSYFVDLVVVELSGAGVAGYCTAGCKLNFEKLLYEWSIICGRREYSCFGDRHRKAISFGFGRAVLVKVRSNHVD